MNLFYETPDGRAKLYLGDAIEVMASFPDACLDVIVTDPPYGLEFMGKEWDSPLQWKRNVNVITNPQGAYERKKGFKQMVRHLSDKKGLLAYQSWTTAWATEAYRILKPGAYMAVMGGTRTHHRLGCGLEDAGFEIRDELAWIYASGFPKNYDVSKGIDKRAGRINESVLRLKKQLISLVEASGKTRKQIDEECGFRATNYLTLPREGKRPDPWINILPSYKKWVVMKEVLGANDDLDLDSAFQEVEREIIGKGYRIRRPSLVQIVGCSNGEYDLTAPATPEAQYWEGYGTALKPAHEPIWLCKKPNEGTYVDNVLEHGCGAMNIDGTRISTQDKLGGGMLKGTNPVSEGWDRPWRHDPEVAKRKAAETVDKVARAERRGRWPANVIVDCYPDEFQGGVVLEGEKHKYADDVMWIGGRAVLMPSGDKEGKYLQGGVVIEGEGQTSRGTSSKHRKTIGDGNIYQGGKAYETREHDETIKGNGLLGPYTRFFVIPKPSKAEKTCGGKVENKHVTVKPVRLGMWLIKLITPHQHPVIVADLFCGSGSFLISGLRLNQEQGYQIEMWGIDKDEDSVETTRERLKAERTLQGILL